MIWSLTLKAVGSKGGIAGIAVILLVVMAIYYNVKIAGIQAFNAIEVSSLEKALLEEETKAAHFAKRDEICQIDVVSLRDKIMVQNDRIDDMKVSAEDQVARAVAEATKLFTPPEEIKKKVTHGYGPIEMNLLTAEVFGEGVL